MAQHPPLLHVHTLRGSTVPVQAAIHGARAAVGFHSLLHFFLVLQANSFMLMPWSRQEAS